MKTSTLLMACLFVLGIASVASAKDATTVPYPTGYRHWTHVKSMVLLPDHALAATFGGIHHLYANDRAVEGYRTGKFADGSVIVFDLLDYNVADGAGTEGARKFTGVMLKNAKDFPATGGWGFEGFAGNSTTERMVTDGGASCFGCHVGQKDHGYVFSKMR